MTGPRVENAIDMHCHFGPDAIKGDMVGHHGVTAVQAAREARDTGHRGVVLKSHSFASPQLAASLAEEVEGLAVFGGICTDQLSGGLNVQGVAAALSMGARIVWLPTVHSHQEWLNGKAEFMGLIGEGIRVIDDAGRPVEAVREIADLCRQHDAVLATGHTTAEEHHVIVKTFAREGKVLVTHAGERMAGPHLTPQQARELADMGAYVELTAQCCQPLWGMEPKTPEQMVEQLRHIGCERCVLSTDYGWTSDLPNPAPGLMSFLESLWHHGLSEDDLSIMAARNPAYLLGLEG
ncbi:MAG TPA: DUF6282 family protein [Novosphingobium sp.]|nr:DUF6282 family protein [Novosphingobium sp.]